jgi:hypothetical protein
MYQQQTTTVPGMREATKKSVLASMSSNMVISPTDKDNTKNKIQ